ncbi:hypothetical protein SDC9_95648 [bioreactor metagenome]|uniref:Uncharacterized protein n=1 Tax=bioreactor metagenome TaxID=1076179 RepID=A0A645A9F9_9ZZZZ
MKITIEFRNIEEYVEFNKKTATKKLIQEIQEFIPEDSINGKHLKNEKSTKRNY